VAAAREAAAAEVAREIAAREAALKETAAKEAAARELAAKEAAARELAAREAAAKELAAKEAAAKEAAAREMAAKEAAREAAAKEAAMKEAAAKEAAAREAAARSAAREAAAAEARTWHPQPRGRAVFRDCPDCPEVVWLPQGELIVGQPSAGSGPRYAVKLSYMLAVGRFKVTIAEWDACVAAGGCRRRPGDFGWGRGRQPVMNVSWEDAQQYAAWLSRKTSKNYRLLTGAEWEYAARSGSEVYDMYGAMSEWVENCYQYRDARNGGKTWTLECTNQTLRGGNWPSNTKDFVARSFVPYNYYDSRIGFRIARTD
jgi:formylglycine-generating enzyme required for sulfatase activity